MTALLGASAAVARARRFTTFPTGQCLRYTSSVLTNGKMLGVYAPYALHAWDHAKYRHAGDRKPPAGVPVWFNHGSANVYGHICISLGGGKIRTTDWPSRGRVGETTITELERRWGRKYVGWAEDLYGFRIPGFPRPVKWVLAPYPGRSKQGSTGAAVHQIQTRLNQLGYKVTVDSSYGPKTAAAVRAFQKAQHVTADGIVGPVTWARLKIYQRG